MALYDYIYERPARKHFRWWHAWAARSRLQPMIEAARMLKRRLENIINVSPASDHERKAANRSMPKSNGSSTRLGASETG